MPKFTPGKWELRGQRIWVPGSKVGDIAHVYCKDTQLSKDFDKDETAKANAVLIAEAPMLFEAACEVVADFEFGDLAGNVRKLNAVLTNIERG